MDVYEKNEECQVRSASKMIIVSKCKFYTTPSAVARARCSVLFRIRAPNVQNQHNGCLIHSRARYVALPNCSRGRAGEILVVQSNVRLARCAPRTQILWMKGRSKYSIQEVRTKLN